MQEQPPRRRGVIVRLVFSLLLIALASLIFLYRDSIIDHITVWRFTPSAEVSKLARTTSMTDLGTFYFYASQPAVESREIFNGSCTQHGEQTVVLGCYVVRRIHIFDVTDTRLNGIKEVTAAHEMLHAAYDRLASGEKKQLNALIEQQYARLTDERIRALITAYDSSEPGERLNELHSILGTEVASLSPRLEDYYRRYFIDRAVVVRLSATYESVFTELKSRQQSLLVELKRLSATISSDISAYNTAIGTLNSDIAAFNTRARSSGFTTQAQFNSERAKLVDQQTSLNARRDAINAAIASYNGKRAELEALNGQATSLNSSINSLAPVPSL